MDDQDCRKLMKNLTTLKERLGKQSHDFDSIIDILIEKGVFIFNKKDEIYAGKTESQKMDIFLKSLMASGPRAYGQFRDALLSFKDSRYEDVVSALDRTELTFVRGKGDRGTITTYTIQIDKLLLLLFLNYLFIWGGVKAIKSKR